MWFAPLIFFLIRWSSGCLGHTLVLLIILSSDKQMISFQLRPDSEDYVDCAMKTFCGMANKEQTGGKRCH